MSTKNIITQYSYLKRVRAHFQENSVNPTLLEEAHLHDLPWLTGAQFSINMHNHNTWSIGKAYKMSSMNRHFEGNVSYVLVQQPMFQILSKIDQRDN